MRLALKLAEHKVSGEAVAGEINGRMAVACSQLAAKPHCGFPPASASFAPSAEGGACMFPRMGSRCSESLEGVREATLCRWGY